MPIRVVVVDDSTLMRSVITGLLEQDPDLRVVGAAGNGRDAIALVEQLRPDIITMDVRMPVMDGLAATEHLMAYCPTPILVLTSAVDSVEANITFKMLAAGALEVVEKPRGASSRAFEHTASDLIRRVKTLARVKVVTHLRGRRRSLEAAIPAPQPVLARLAPRPKERGVAAFPVIIIGASTGGPRVLARILAELPAGLPAAVLLVQHIAAGFSGVMAEWLAGGSRLPVRLAAHGQALTPGEVLIAPDLRDLQFSAEGLVQLHPNPGLIQCPEIDRVMSSAAAIFRQRAIGVLLTGMGRDGAVGLLAIRRAGGHTIAQDEASSTIFGMPRAAIELGAAIDVLAPPGIPARLVELIA